MKFKYLILALASLAFSSCSDTLDQIGSSIQPDTDPLTVYTDTFDIESSTVLIDSIYARTSTGLLGNFQDDTYGNLKCDYYGQLYCPENFLFHEELVGNKLDSTTILLTYTSYVGDSLAPMQASVYKITDPDFFKNGANAYSNAGAPDAGKLSLLAKRGYSAYDANLSDSLRDLYKSNKYIEVKLDTALNNKFYKDVTSTTNFESNANFQKYFPGLYITTNYGDGSIIKVISTKLNFYFKYTGHYTGTDGVAFDSITVGARSINISKEVYQVNRYKNDDIDGLINDTTATYIKTPAGLFTKLTFPIGKMAKSIDASKGLRLNGVSLDLGSFRVKNLKNILQPPTNMLLVKASQLDSLFSGDLTYDPEKNPYATFSSSDNSYTFSNLRTFFDDELSAGLPETATEDVYLVPFSILNTNSSGTITKISHYFEPAAVRLKTNGLKMSIIYSK